MGRPPNKRMQQTVGALARMDAPPAADAQRSADKGLSGVAALFKDDDVKGTESWPVLARDTLADRLAMSGCGTILAGLVTFAMVVYGALDPFGWPGAVVLGALFISASGVLSAVYGARFVRALLKLMEWL